MSKPMASNMFDLYPIPINHCVTQISQKLSQNDLFLSPQWPDLSQVPSMLGHNCLTQAGVYIPVAV